MITLGRIFHFIRIHNGREFPIVTLSTAVLQREIGHYQRAIFIKLGRLRIRIDRELVRSNICPEQTQIALSRFRHRRHVAVNTVHTKVFLHIVVLVLPVACFTGLDDSLVRIDFFIGEKRTGMGIVAGNTAGREMFRAKQIFVLLVMSLKPILTIDLRRVASHVTVATKL